MASKKQGTYQSGKNKGKLKPGYRYAKGGRIVKSRTTAKKRKASTLSVFKRKAKRAERKLLNLF
ncbi:hypothetical protein [Celerinatantimonas sp. MCCC 1A17872]|uniref:hypothetical protein n=1 Tax=Celerinatantimonas sp. MCCC 1A17872 TaxID=3177514 RepID=UPI0038CAED2F